MIEKLAGQGKINETAARDAGLIMTHALDIKSAEAIGSKAVEIILNSQPGIGDLVAANLSMSSPDGSAPAISAVSAAGWSSDRRNIVMTLESALIPGTIYTLRSGEKSVTFIGQPFSTELVEKSIQSENCKEVCIEFNRPIQLDKLSIRVLS